MTDRPLRVLFLCSEYSQPWQPLGGVFFRDQARALRRAGVFVDVVFVEPRSLRTLSLLALRRQWFQTSYSNEDGVPTLRQHGWNPGLPRPLAGRAYSWLTVRLANRYIRDHARPDIVHAHCALWVGPAAARVALIHRLPLVLTEHHSSILFRRDAQTEAALSRAYKAPQRLFAVSQTLANAMARRVPGRTIEILPNVVDTRFFVPDDARVASRPLTRIAAIGSLDENKSHDVLLRAFARARVDRPDLVLRIAGEGPLRKHLEELARELGVSKSVRFEGVLRREGVRSLLFESDLLVHPSKSETFGVALIEAAAVGLPVVATRCGGPAEIVTEGSGLLVEVGDDEALGAAILVALSRRWNSAEIRRDCVERFGAEAVTKRLIDTYMELRSGDWVYSQ